MGVDTLTQITKLPWLVSEQTGNDLKKLRGSVQSRSIGK